MTVGDGAILAAAQTIVSTAENRDKQKQGLAPRETLLPNRDQRQQDFTTPAMLLGYARVSKAGDQDTAAQVGALKAAGCARVYEDTASGGRWDRPELHRLLDQLRDGDALVVWKLDRLSRSLKDLLHVLERIDATKATFRSLTSNSKCFPLAMSSHRDLGCDVGGRF